MTIKFAVRGGALSAYKHSGSGKNASVYDLSGSGAPNLVVDAGAIGGSAINYDGGGQVRGHIFPAFDNSTKTGIISLLARIAPTYSGSPGSNMSVLCLAGIHHTSVVAQLLQIDHLTNGNLILTLLGAWSPTAGQYYDIVFTWDGTTAANGIKVYIDGTLFAQLTAGVTWAAGAIHAGINIGVGCNSIILGAYKLNEYVLWDSVIDPTSGGLNLNGSARASFVAVSGVLDPTASSDPGIANVRLATAYEISGAALTGTAAIPSAANVKNGVAVDATTGSLVSTDPGQANVRLGTGYTIESAAKTGTAAIPGASSVKSGVAVDAGVGSLVSTDPGQTNVKAGVSYTIESAAKVGTYVRIALTDATLIAEAPGAASPVTLYFSQGDDITLQLQALIGQAGAALDLTGATFSTLIKATDGSQVTIPDSAHTADPDQVANKGKFLVRVDDTLSKLAKVGTKKEIVTSITIGPDTVAFHGTAILTVLSGQATV